MKTPPIVMSLFFSLVHAGPARRDCGETKTFTATNQCGVGYGGTWIECASGITEMPTFYVPECSPSPTISPNASSNATVTSDYSTITPAPTINPPSVPYPMNSTSSCSPLYICVDAMQVCGPYTQLYGACYDTCTKTSLEPPTCTLPPVEPQAGAPQGGRGRNRTNPGPKPKPPPRVHNDRCDDRPWMCPPAGW